MLSSYSILAKFFCVFCREVLFGLVDIVCILLPAGEIDDPLDARRDGEFYVLRVDTPRLSRL